MKLEAQALARAKANGVKLGRKPKLAPHTCRSRIGKLLGFPGTPDCRLFSSILITDFIDSDEMAPLGRCLGTGGFLISNGLSVHTSAPGLLT